MDVEILARIQFAFTIAFHYIYPPLSIGLGLIMVAAILIQPKGLVGIWDEWRANRASARKKAKA